MIYCEQCKFWAPFSRMSENAKLFELGDGECRIYPPVLIQRWSGTFMYLSTDVAKTAFPITKNYEGCGEGEPEGRLRL